jgi:protein-tyrosine phosphatase
MSLDYSQSPSQSSLPADSSMDGGRDSASTLSARPSSMHVDMLYGHTVSPIIEGYLYISDQQAPVDSNLLNFLGVTHIVNASNETVPNKFPDSFKYYNVNVEDDNSDDIFSHFDAVADFLADAVVEPTKDKIPSEIISDLSHSTATMMEEIIKATVQNVEKALESSNSTNSTNERIINPLHSIGQQCSMIDTGPEQDVAVGIQTLHLEQQVCSEKVILFHCRMGISRSATLLIAYLINSKNMTLKEAYGLVKRKRAKICPTPMFADALVKYERMIHPELVSSTMTVFQLCGTTKMRTGSEGDAGSDMGRDTTSAKGSARMTPLDLSPINEQDNSDRQISKAPEEEKTGCSCCVIM